MRDSDVKIQEPWGHGLDEFRGQGLLLSESTGGMATAISVAAPPLGGMEQYRVLLCFRSRSDEDTYMRSRWLRDQLRIRVAVVLLTVLAITETLDVDLADFRREPVRIAVLLLCRVAPITMLWICAFILPTPRTALIWSPLSAACTLLVALAVFLQDLPSLNTNTDGSSNRDRSRQSWLPLAWIALHPLYLAFGLCATWYDVLWSGAVCMALLGGLILRFLLPSTATAVVLAVVVFLLAVSASYAQDAERREAFRVSISSRRQTESLLEGAIERVVSSEMHQKVIDGMKRSMIMVSEVTRGGTVSWVSPGCRQLLGLQPAELLHESTFRWVHPADLAKVQVSNCSRESSCDHWCAIAATRAGEQQPTPILFLAFLVGRYPALHGWPGGREFKCNVIARRSGIPWVLQTTAVSSETGGSH
jgi:PAS domain-containing protein